MKSPALGLKVGVAAALLSCPVHIIYSQTIVVPKDKPTIGAAISAAMDGDTIAISYGTYNEMLTITKSLVIIGCDSASPVVQNNVSQDLLTITNASDITIRNLSIRSWFGSIRITGCRNVAVSDVHCESVNTNRASGVVIIGSDSITFRNAVVYAADGPPGGSATGYGWPGGDGGDSFFLSAATHVRIDSSELHPGKGGPGGWGSRSHGADGKPGYALHVMNSSDLKTSDNSYFGAVSVDSSSTILTGVQKPTSENVPSFQMDHNYPNPFNPVTTINFSIPAAGFVSLTVYDQLGRPVANLVSETLSAGVYSRRWDASELSSGIYYCRFQSQNVVKTLKLVLLR
ncbi:MAG: T9SS type A sorting domain-containing protein [Bacteroidota bacterium]